MDRYDQPYPIRRRANGCEVIMLDQGQIWDYVRCGSLEDAEAVADARLLNGIFMCGGQADKIRVNRCLRALRCNGLDGRVLLVRRVMSLA